MKNAALTLAFLALAFWLPACGFSPLYGDQTRGAAPSENLNSIKIDVIPDREGQILRNYLIDRFYKGGFPADPRYRLSVNALSESITDLDITKSSDATRAQLRINTAMSLFDINTGEMLMTRNLTGIASYNILQSQFTTRVSEQDARDSVLADIARQIELQTVLFLRENGAN